MTSSFRSLYIIFRSPFVLALMGAALTPILSAEPPAARTDTDSVVETFRGGSSPEEAKREGLRAFADVTTVLRHPRCLNCHPSGEVPRQTEARLAHFPTVRRGADDRGVAGMRCTTCHQVENQLNGIPGAPGWSVAPRTMAWESLSDHDLAEQLKDPQRNGGRTLRQILDHLNHEKLVLWAWQPGGHRAPPPLSHEEFVKRFEDWIAAGAPSPAAEVKGGTP